MRHGIAVWLADLIERAWGWILLAALGASLISIPVVQSLTFEENLLDLLPKKSSVVQNFSLFMKHFSVEDSLIVLLQCSDYNRLVTYAEALAARLRNHPSVKNIQYRTEFKWKGENPYQFLFNILGDIEFKVILERLSRAGLERSVASMKALFLAPALPVDRRLLVLDPLGLLPLMAKHMSSKGFPIDPVSGYYLSEKRTALLMILRPVSSSYEVSFTKKLLASFEEIQEAVGHEMGKGPPVQISYTGSYVYALYFARWLKRDFTVLSIISLGGLLILFYLFFRGLLVLPLILLSLAAAVLWTLALGGLILGYLNMISIAFSAIILGLGIDIAIHFYARYREEMGHSGIKTAIERTFSRVGRAIFTATTTTAFVFFVFAFSNFKGIAELGALCGIGMLINLAAMMLVFPCLLVGASKFKMLRITLREGRWERNLEKSLQRFYLYRGGKVLFVALLILAPMSWLARGVRFEQSIQTLEPRDLPPAVVDKRIQELFGRRGQKLIMMVRDRDPERVLQKNDALKEELQGLVAVGIIDTFDTLSYFLPSGRTQRRNLTRLGDFDKEKVLGDLREILQSQGFRLEPFSRFFRNFSEAGGDVISIGKELPAGAQAFVGNYLRRDGEDFLIVTYAYCAETQDFMEAYHRLSSGEGFWREGALITGFPLVEREFGRIVKQDFGLLSAISILGVLGILLCHFRGWRESIVILVPLFGVAISFLALMHILNISINLFNLIVIPLIFGIGVDDHVHILHRYIEYREKDGIGEAVSRSGKAVVLTSLTTIVGFGALAASRFDGLTILGITALIGIGLAMFSALLVMPCLIAHILTPPAKPRFGTH